MHGNIATTQVVLLSYDLFWQLLRHKAAKAHRHKVERKMDWRPERMTPFNRPLLP